MLFGLRSGDFVYAAAADEQILARADTRNRLGAKCAVKRLTPTDDAELEDFLRKLGAGDPT
jgi:hypothetical protein